MQMMAGDYWEDAVYGVAPLSELDTFDLSVVFSWLSQNVPARGAKIDWSRAPGRHAHWSVADDTRLAAMVSREVSMRLRHGAVVEHAGDGLSPYGVRFGVENAGAVLAALLEIPEHHYFVAQDRSWLVVATSEGDLDVLDEIGPRGA
ncbi:hypothetical protein [Micromonospora sp. WMMD1155]|uniref:hypothetical protein n=1 Tax=Micromonospora sp. WMMD1155 TaxID=3016094 RepID=UPI00249CAFCC|nr:hypothetical protein [Micromonospora sp. WMMD1155]WFE50478.1 hypothetical protein O7617_09170 [Micromonospora sp. WMMD1155]